MEFMKTLPDNSIDLICTDPPYQISKESHFDRGGAWNNAEDKRKMKTPPKTDFGEWDKIPLNLDSLFKEYYRCLKPHGTVICFYDIWKISELKSVAEKHRFKQLRLCRWDKTNPVPVNSKLNYLSNASEYFISCVKKSKPIFNSEYDKGIYIYPICSGQERTEHPTQKPLVLMNDLILKHSNPQNIVFDPFMGSGTTGVACLQNNRKFIGCEIDEHYFNIAKQRIENCC